MAGPSSRTVADRQTSIQIQTSVYGIPVSVVYGTNRVSANLVWFANFQADSQTQKTGGKGMGGSSTSTTYTYTASAILALAEGTIDGVGDVWKDKDKTTLAALGLTLFTGSPNQAVWSFLSGYSTPGNWSHDYDFGYNGTSASFVDQAINYSGTAYLASSAYDLGDAASIPNHSFEVRGKLLSGSGIVDASPAAIIPDMLTSAQYGLNFASTKIDALSSYATYCRASGLFFSPAYTQQRATADCLQELCDASNAAPFWSDGKLKVAPYGDATITGNGVTFTPNLTPAYDLADDDFLNNGEEPIRVSRVTPADAYNRVQVQFRNRNNQYNQEVVSVEDQDAIEKYGLRTAPMITADFICEAGVAKLVAQLAMQRMLYKRNQYEFDLGARFAMLEPMDIVTLTDPGLSMNRLPVRLLEIQEQDDGYSCIAEDLPIGVASAPIYTHDNGLRWQNSTSIPAQNAADPIIFEMPAGISVTGLALAVAAGGQAGDLMYGGCRVWLSLDGLNYREEGIINGSSRYGVLTAALPSHAAGIDTSSTMSVALTSGGQLLSGSSNDLATGTTQIIVGDEYLAYQNATLTGANAYNLTTLKRGLYDTPSPAHTSGTPWVRVDSAVAELTNIDESMIGQTVYIKLTSFNVYGSAEQSLADVVPYAYTVTGAMKALRSDYVLGYLTNDSAVVAADSNGTVTSAVWATAGGQFIVVDGLAQVASGVIYSVVSSTSVTIAIDANTGAYTVFGMSANTGSAILRASYKNVVVDKIYSIAKSRQGQQGQQGNPGPPGSPGETGASATTAFLTNEAVQLSAYPGGGIKSYSGASGEFKVFSGTQDVSNSFTLSTQSNPQNLTVVYSGRNYSVTGGFDQNENTASVTIRATGSGTYAGVTFDKVFSLSKAENGFFIVEAGQSFPADDSQTGPVIFNENDGKLYRWNKLTQSWTATVPAIDIDGLIEDFQLESVSAEKINGLIENSQLHSISSAKIDGAILASQVDARGLDILDDNGVPVFSSDGSIGTSASININGNNVLLSQVAENALTPALHFVGDFPSPPTATTLGSFWRQNAVYKSTVDGNSYVLTGTPLTWEPYLESGTAFVITVESTNGTVFRLGQGRTTTLKARLFKNGAEVTDQTPAGWFKWRRISLYPQQPPHDDVTWNNLYQSGYKQVTIDIDQVLSKATFFCDVTSN